MRRPDWQSRFAAVVKEYQNAPFVWGEHDCCLFAADCIRAVVGVDPAESFRGRYTTAIDAYVVIEQSGAEDFAALVDQMTAQHGFPPIDPVYAQRGDVGLIKGPPFGDTLGVCLGPRFAFMGLDEMIYHDRDSLIRAWRVG